MSRIALLLLIIFFSACQKSQERSIVAKLGPTTDISMNEIDALIQPELYESLFNTYYARKIVTDELVAQKLIAQTAKQLGVTSDSLLAQEIAESSYSVERFVMDNNLGQGVPDPEHPGHVWPLNSERGKKALEEAYHKHIVTTFVETLKKENHVELFLNPPLPPPVNLSEIPDHQLTRAESKNTFWIFSDFGCQHCIEFYPVLEKLKKKYDHKIEFRYTTMTNDISEPVLLGEFSGRNGKFSEAISLIFKQLANGHMESEQIIAHLGLSFDSFKRFSEQANEHRRIKITYERLMTLKKFQITPTIVINNRIYYGDISFSKIDEYLSSNDK